MNLLEMQHDGLSAWCFSEGTPHAGADLLEVLPSLLQQLPPGALRGPSHQPAACPSVRPSSCPLASERQVQQFEDFGKKEPCTEWSVGHAEREREIESGAQRRLAPCHLLAGK